MRVRTDAETKIETDVERETKGGDKDGGRHKFNNCLHFSICACHPCAVAMLVFSVSFQR